MTDAHLKAAREWLVAQVERNSLMEQPREESLAALLAEWERKGLERAAITAYEELTGALVVPASFTERIRALAQPPSTDKQEGKP